MRLGGRQQIASGSKPHWKLDVSSKRFLCECKLTENNSYSITADLLEKVRRESVKQLKIGIIELNIAGRTVYVVPPEVILEYNRLADEDEKWEGVRPGHDKA